jgi:DNA-binding NarL/FixJ family response regulator
MTQKTKIIVAESLEIFRKSLVVFLESSREFDVVADAATGKEVVDILKTTPAEIVLLDTELPVLNGKATLDIIRKRFPDVKVIILSDQASLQVQADFMSHGANSYLGKNCDIKTLFTAINKVKHEGYFFNDSTSKALLDKVLKSNSYSANSIIHFNDREIEVLKGICDGKTNKEMAAELHLSSSTIDFYRTKIYSKIKCNNVAGLLKYALRNGIVSLADIN